MDHTTKTMIVSLFVALAGWLATAHWIRSRQKLSAQIKRMLIIPAWFPWMGIAIGAPVAQGQIAVLDALQAIVSFSFGMLVWVYVARRNTRRS